MNGVTARCVGGPFDGRTAILAPNHTGPFDVAVGVDPSNSIDSADREATIDYNTVTYIPVWDGLIWVPEMMADHDDAIRVSLVRLAFGVHQERMREEDDE